MRASNPQSVSTIVVDSFVRDGVGDSEVLAAAFAAAERTGASKVIFGTHTYIISDAVKVPSNVELVGNGATLRWPSTGAAHSILDVSGAENVLIHDLTFFGGGGHNIPVPPRTHAVVIDGSENVSLEHVTFSSIKAVNIIASDDVLIDQSTFKGGMEGIVVGGLNAMENDVVGMSTHIAITNNTMSGYVREAIDLNSNASDVIIKGNTIAGSTTVNADELIDVGGGVMNNISILDNKLDGLNTIARGIWVKMDAHNVTISGNEISGLDYTNTASSGIRISSSQDVDVHDNSIQGAHVGIALVGTVDANLEHNLFSNIAGQEVYAADANGSISIVGTDVPNAASVQAAVPDSSSSQPGTVASPFRVTGSASGDFVQAGNGDDLLNGLAGDDLLYGGTGSDTLTGGEGADRLYGNSGSDVLSGEQGDDALYGSADRDRLEGGDGNDRLDGGTGADTMLGGLGDDRYIVDDAGDVVSEAGGGGVDTVVSSISFTLGDGLENLTLSGSKVLTGIGNEAQNRIHANDAGNALSGLGGKDELIGGDGADTLIGGLGADKLTGGVGADTFRYGSAYEGGDTILDFVSGEDSIEIFVAGFGGRLAAGDLTAAQFTSNITGKASSAAGIGQFVYETGAGKLWWDANGAGDQGSTVIATLTGHPALVASDIHLVG